VDFATCTATRLLDICAEYNQKRIAELEGHPGMFEPGVDISKSLRKPPIGEKPEISEK